MVRAAAVACVLAAACVAPVDYRNGPGDGPDAPDGSTIDAPDGSTIDAPDGLPIDAIDAPPPDILAYLTVGASQVGTTDYFLNLATTIDTTNLTITPPAPAGVVFERGALLAGGEAAVLRVRDLTVANVMTVVGDRPFAIVSGGRVIIDVTIDAGAVADRPGPGGSTAGDGPNPGFPGLTQNLNDAGGGGGGHGSVGGAGGAVSGQAGGPGGGTIGPGIPGTLRGGSGGGSASPRACTVPPRGGGGGGAVFIYARTRIQLDGRIFAGGGGARAATGCNGINDDVGGSGGGAGGLIDLQSPTIAGGGRLIANGGGGAGAHGDGVTEGQGGGDARSDGDTVALGGVGGTGLPAGTRGGDGAIQGMPAGHGGNQGGAGNGNAGGGGGGHGVIVLRWRDAAPSILTRPDAVTTPF